MKHSKAKIDPKEKNLLRQASKSHSKKHMAIMNALMNKGKSFKIAHKEALKITKQVAKKKNNLLNKIEHETGSRFKKTSQSKKRPKFSSMNKSKRRSFKKANRGGR